MTPFTAGLMGLGLMLVLLFMGMPIGFTLAITGFLGSIYILGINSALPQLHLTFFSLVSKYDFTVLPFFIMMGYFADASGISSDLYFTAEKWLRRLPGGLALATIAGCAGFAAISGSSVATAATMGAVALPAMKKYNYDDSLAAGTVAAGGTLGFLIPPSVAFVVYAIMAQESVGKLLLAGYIPGITLAITFMLIVLIRVKLNPKLAPVNLDSVSWKERIFSLKNIWGVVVVVILVMGGIYFGFFTPTEAGGVGAFFLFVFAIGRRRLNWSVLNDTLRKTATISCMIFVILYGAYLFGDFLALSRIPIEFMQAMTSLTSEKYVILALIVLIYLILGCFIESVPMIVLTVPVVLPVITEVGFSPIWFGVIVVLMVEAALITPPVGMNVYVITGIMKNVPMMTIFRGAIPFVIAMLAVVVLLAIFPMIALFLPQLIK